MYQIELTNDEIQELKILHKYCCKDKINADRIKAILLLNDKYSVQKVAEILLLDEDTITNHKKRFLNRTNSTDWLETVNNGYQGKLSDEQEMQVKQFVNDNIVTNSDIVKQFVLENWEISFSTSGIIALMHRLNLVYKFTKRAPANYDQEKQAEFKELYELLESSLTENEAVFFIDGVHPQHNTEPTRVWVEKGTDKEIETNTGRERLNINGAYNPHNQDVIAREDDTIDADSTIKLLQSIENNYSDKKVIYVIADNARTNKNKKVFEYLKTSRIIMIFLPPYSPNLNLIERLWKLLRRLKINTIFYETYKDFRDSVMGFFENISLYIEEIKKSVGTKMHLLQPV